jgi:hypothetical protein
LVLRVVGRPARTGGLPIGGVRCGT